MKKAWSSLVAGEEDCILLLERKRKKKDTERAIRVGCGLGLLADTFVKWTYQKRTSQEQEDPRITTSIKVMSYV